MLAPSLAFPQPLPVGGTTDGRSPAKASCAAHRGAAGGPAAAALARVQAQRWSRAACYFGPAMGIFLENAEHPFSEIAPQGMTLRCCSRSAPGPTTPLLGEQS